MGMCSQNEHTRQLQKTKPASKAYIDNFDKIFRKDKQEKPNDTEERTNRKTKAPAV